MGRNKKDKDKRQSNARFAWCLCDLEYTESHDSCPHIVGGSTCQCLCHPENEKEEDDGN